MTEFNVFEEMIKFYFVNSYPALDARQIKVEIFKVEQNMEWLLRIEYRESPTSQSIEVWRERIPDYFSLREYRIPDEAKARMALLV